jgi:hypothetical protein
MGCSDAKLGTVYDNQKTKKPPIKNLPPAFCPTCRRLKPTVNKVFSLREKFPNLIVLAAQALFPP